MHARLREVICMRRHRTCRHVYSASSINSRAVSGNRHYPGGPSTETDHTIRKHVSNACMSAALPPALYFFTLYLPLACTTKSFGYVFACVGWVHTTDPDAEREINRHAGKGPADPCILRMPPKGLANPLLDEIPFHRGTILPKVVNERRFRGK